MEPYIVRRSIRIVKVLGVHGKLKLREMLVAFFSKNERMKILDSYRELGILEARKYFVVEPESEKYPFLETFIFGIYKFFDYRGKTVIDVGAQTGDSVLYFSHQGAKMIYAFEPLKNNFKILEKNDTQNKINCTCYNIGLGDITKNIDTAVSGSMATATPITDSLEHEHIKIDRLDNLNIYADIIKIDVEGSETEVLKGGLNTIKNAKTIIIETHSKNLQVEVAKLLSGTGLCLSQIIRNYTARNVRVEYWFK
jgi:FkbM family methyltransferase